MKSLGLKEKEEKIIIELAEKIVKHGMSVPAIIFLEGYKPLSYVGSQAMLAFKPIISIIRSFKSYDIIQKIMEKRDGVEFIIQQIERIEREKNIKIKKGE